MADTDLIERLNAVATSRETISHDEYGARKALGLLNGRDKLIAEAATALTASRAECEGLRASDYFGELVARARQSAAKASAKFPQPNYVTLKIAEEAGEVVRGAVHYAENRMEWDEVEGEIVQLLAMMIRFVTEGDQINGITPPARASLSQKEAGHVE